LRYIPKLRIRETEGGATNNNNNNKKKSEGSWRHGSEIECLPSKYKTLSSNPITAKTTKSCKHGERKKPESHSSIIW
jgi:hypothetical protein